MAGLTVPSCVDIDEAVIAIEIWRSEVWLFVAYMLTTSDIDI
jgi:hypothetical protein